MGYQHAQALQQCTAGGNAYCILFVEECASKDLLVVYIIPSTLVNLVQYVKSKVLLCPPMDDENLKL